MKRYDVTALGELLIDFTENGLSNQGNYLNSQEQVWAKWYGTKITVCKKNYLYYCVMQCYYVLIKVLTYGVVFLRKYYHCIEMELNAIFY